MKEGSHCEFIMVESCLIHYVLTNQELLHSLLFPRLLGPVAVKPLPKLDYEDVFKQSSETNTTVYCGNLPNEALSEGKEY